MAGTNASKISQTKTRLSVEDWLVAGFRALARSGPDALRAEPLARELGTTKGSFYWHFKDLPDYLGQLIGLWEERAFDAVVARLDPALPPRLRLEKLCEIAVGFRDPTYGGAGLEPALRAWALNAPEVARAVALMDARRVSYLGELYRAAGLHDPALPQMTYALAVGLETMASPDARQIMDAFLRKLP